jgi:hypothetical protein
VSRPVRPLPPAVATARAGLPADEAADFDRLASGVLASPSTVLGAVLRARLPGMAGVRWLRTAGLPPTTRAEALTAEQWLSLYRCASAAAPAPSTAGSRGRGPGGRPSAHGHAPGAMAAPRWH